MHRTALIGPYYTSIISRERIPLRLTNLSISYFSHALALLQLHPPLFVRTIEKNPVHPRGQRRDDEAVESVVQTPSAVPVSVQTLGGEDKKNGDAERKLQNAVFRTNSKG